MKQWLKANGRRQAVATDKWYVEFARTLAPLIRDSRLFEGRGSRQEEEAALALALYFQDAIGQNGGWAHFTALCHQRYRHPVPFYQTGNSYVADEINLEDIQFVLWTQLAHPATHRQDDYVLFNPHDNLLLQLSQCAYGLMDRTFEEAPIADAPSRHWVAGTAGLEIPSAPLPLLTPTEAMNVHARRCLEHAHGRPLQYFSDYAELKQFFVGVLQWEDKPSHLLPDLAGQREFVIFANEKGMLVAPGVASYFSDVNNPLYDKERSVRESYRLFCQPGLCPFDLLKFGLQAGFLADARFPFDKGEETLQRHADFVARYYLGEFYEGQ